MSAPSPSLIDFLPLAVVEIDSQLNVCQSNSIAKQLFEIEDGKPFSLPPHSLEADGTAESLVQHLEVAIRRRKPIHDLVFSIVVAGDLLDWYQLKAEPLFHKEKTGLVLSFININLRKEQERIVALQHARLSESGRQIGVNILASGVAHEINNPLSIMRGYADIMRRKVRKGQLTRDALDKELHWINKNILRISEIVQTLRSFAEASGNPEKGEYTVDHIIKTALMFCSERMKDRLIETRMEGFDEEILIDCQWADLSQAFYNILHNAFDALDNVEIAEKWVTISCTCYEDRVEIDIANNGPPIPAEIAGDIMLPFFTTKNPGSGMGLGLTVAQEHIVKHGGSISVNTDSSLTVFTVSLPKSRRHSSAA